MSDIADKIKKLIDKARGTDNPNEAAIFMNKATAMMAEHGLSMEAIDLSAIKEAEVKSRFSVSKPKDYEVTLMSSIATSFGCELLWRASHSWNRGDNYAAIIFIGPKNRLQLATYAADVLGRQLEKARKGFSQKQSDTYWKYAADVVEEDDWRDYKKDVCDEWSINYQPNLRRMIAERITKEADSFAVGWVMEIRKKVTKFALNDREQALIQQYVNGAVGKDEDGNAREVKSKDSQLSYASMQLGREAAKDAHLHRPMEGSTETVNVLGQTKYLSN